MYDEEKRNPTRRGGVEEEEEGKNRDRHTN